jgi:hypothetical protein
MRRREFIALLGSGVADGRSRRARSGRGNSSTTWPIHSFCAGLSRAKQTLGSMTT